MPNVPWSVLVSIAGLRPPSYLKLKALYQLTKPILIRGYVIQWVFYVPISKGFIIILALFKGVFHSATQLYMRSKIPCSLGKCIYRLLLKKLNKNSWMELYRILESAQKRCPPALVVTFMIWYDYLDVMYFLD